MNLWRRKKAKLLPKSKKLIEIGRLKTKRRKRRRNDPTDEKNTDI